MGGEKKVVQEVSGWLRVHQDGSVDRTCTGPPQVKVLTQLVPEHAGFIHGVTTRDLTVDDNGEGLRVRIYIPEQATTGTLIGGSRRLPIILHFHGGGFCISRPDMNMYYHFYARLACSLPALCISVFLRQAPENRLPAAVQDAHNALLWLRSVATRSAGEPRVEQLGDFQRVFLIGDSSGANLVHEVAALVGRGPDTSPLRLSGGILIHPGFVRSERSSSEREEVDSPLLTQDMVDKFLAMALPEGSTKDHPITCPMGEAAPPLGGLNLPPFMVCVAEKDKIKDTEMEYYEAMKRAGKEVEVLISEGMGHSFYLNKLAVDEDPRTAAETDRLLDRIAVFVNKH